MPENYLLLKGDKGTSWQFDNSKTLNAIDGYDFQIDLRTGLLHSILFFENNEYMQGIYSQMGR